MLAAFLLSAALAPQPSPDPDVSLRAFLRTRADRRLDPDVRYTSAFVDLNGDGRPEAVARIMGPGYCGTGGCGFLVLQRRGGRWRVINDFAIAHAPIRVLNSRTRGWRDLGAIVAGGGAYRPYEARLRFNGRAYPGNVSVPPSIPLRRRVPGRVLITREDRGRPLF